MTDPSKTALCALIVTGAAFVGAAQTVSAQVAELATAVRADVTKAGLEQHARAIVKYERPSGSAGENAAIDYIVETLRAEGVPVAVHTFRTYASDPVAATVEVPGSDFSPEAITAAFSGAVSALEAPLIDMGTLADLPGLEVGTGERLTLAGPGPFRDLTGAIALIEGQPRNTPTLQLALMGAVGVIYTNPEERLNDLIVTTTWGTPSLRNYHRLQVIPVAQVTKSAGNELRRLVTDRDVQVRLTVEVNAGWKPLRLAVARIPAPEPDAPYVLMGGHIDGWYHGGTDNGGANATMLELVRAFHQNRGTLRRGLVVAWWPGHSNARYSGSTWFADRYFDELRKRAVAYVNVEGLGQIGAKRFGASTTSSLAGLAQTVVHRSAGVSIIAGQPGRNSDQAFNGVGLPLLQINHTRLSEDGGYWWWHTPDDTFDKIDFDVLETDAHLYVDALAALVAAPVLPVDLVAEVQNLGQIITSRQETAGDRFDLAAAVTRQRRLLAIVQEIHNALPREAERDFNLGMVRVLRPLFRVLYDPLSPFHPDPGRGLGLLPGLAPVEILANENPASDRYRFAETSLIRERNRLLEAIDVAIEEAQQLRRYLP
jgi:Iap family predicted aminopeptidase